MSVVSQGLLTGLLEQRRNPVKIKMTTSQITKSEMYFRQEEMGGNSKEQRTYLKYLVMSLSLNTEQEYSVKKKSEAC